MANWKEYTTKTTPEDADEIMIADSKANASKRTPFSGLWNWIANKLATAVISQLETQNKSIIPALNELNSNAVPKKLLFEHTSIEATYKEAKVGISFCKAQGASDFPLPNPLTLIINVKSGEEWGMQYALTSVGKIFTRPVNNGVFTDWIQV